MKRTLLFILCIVILLPVFSQVQWQAISKHQPAEFQPVLISSVNGESIVEFNLEGYTATGVSAPVTNSKIISVPRTAQISEQGAPDLAQLTAALIIPDLANMEVEILESEYYEVANIEIAPSKGDITRNIDPSTVPYVYGPAYQQNAWYPGKLSELADPHIFRDFRGTVVITYPFQYNPVTKVLRVYNKIVVKVKESSALSKQPVNPYYRSKSITSFVEDFHLMYGNRYLNYSPDKYNAPIERGNILVISHPDFINAMMPYVEWKNQIGFPTEIVSVSAIGNTVANIKNYVTNYYNTNGLAFLLLVGDYAQVTSHSYGTYSGSPQTSDNYYGDISGNDLYLEVVVGRFSATTVAHVQTQVQRTLDYEKADGIGSGWQSYGLGLARNEGAGNGHDGGEADYVHMDNIRTRLLAYNYSTVYREYDGNVPGLTNTTAAQISNRINTGVSIINFCNHGNETGWSVGSYTNTQVNALTNAGKLPFVWSVACLVGKFSYSSGDCFAETWLKATNASGEPTGALAFYGSTVNQPWHPPMDAQDEFNRVLCEHFPTKIRRTFGAISASGTMHMLDLGPTNSDRLVTARTWTIFGDPSVMLRTADPLAMTVSHPANLSPGATNMQVTCNEDDAFVSLSINYEIIGTGVVSGGVTNISFPPVSTGDTIRIAVTAYNTIPYLDEIPVEDPSSCPVPYALMQTSATDVSASVQWTGTAGNYEMEWGVSPYTFTGTANITGIYLNTRSFSGLQPETTYEYRVRAICGPGDESDWSSTGTFITESPELVADPVQLDFGYVGSGNSAEMSYQLSGTLLGNGPVIITAPSGYQVSLTSGSGFASSINVSYTPPTLGVITVYVRFAPTGSPAIYNGVISNVGGGASTDVQLSGNSILSYCSSTATNTSDEWITNVAFAGINNSSGSTGYSDFTNLSPAEVIPGNDYTLSASLGMTGTWSEYFVAWIDWNQNGVFESAESYQIGNCNSNGCTVSTTISVPSGAALGTTVMRVVMQYSSYRTDPCGTFTYGEVEDYAVNVISGISCNDFEETTNAQICEGSTYSWRGNNYSVSGTYHDSLFTTNPPGCDSVYILNLTVNPVYEFVSNAEICEGDTYQWQGGNYTVGGTYTETYQTVNGCDSVYILNLTVNPVFEFVSNAEICEGDTYQWQGGNYTAGGTYTETYQTVNGCDSVYILNLTVNPVYEFVSNAEICEGDTYQWQGGNYTVGGTYTETYQTVDGCDSVYILNLTVNPVYEFVSNAEICEGDTYQWQGGNYTAGGTYTETYQTVNGCDSVYILNLTVNPVFEFVNNAEICEGDTYQWQGGNYTVGGTYTETYQTVNGCDSVYILNLTVNPVYFATTDAEVYAHELPYSWEGNLYWSAGFYNVVYSTIHGCDSTLELTLTVLTSNMIWVNRAIGTAVQANWSSIPEATRYEIRYAVSGTGNWVVVAQTTLLERKITGLTPDTDYDLQIRYFDGTVWSGWNAYTPITFNSGLLEIWYSRDIGTKAIVDWTPQADASSYILQYRLSGNSNWSTISNQQQTGFTFSNLTENTTYEFRVIPRYNNISFWFSETYALTTTDLEFVLSRDIGTKAILSIEAIPEATGYLFRWKESTSTLWKSNLQTIPEIVISCSSSGTIFDVQANIYFDGTDWGGTTVKQVTTNVIMISVDNYDGQTATFSWDWLENPVPSAYFLQVREQGTTSWMSYSSAIPNRFVSGLDAQKDYEYRLVVRYGTPAASWGATEIYPLIQGVKEIDIIHNLSFDVYPNPVSDMLTVEMVSDRQSSYLWQMYDMTGKVVMSGDHQVNAGLNYLEIETSSLPEGIYLLHSNVKGKILTERIIKY
jgi:hypothetical protein